MANNHKALFIGDKAMAKNTKGFSAKQKLHDTRSKGSNSARKSSYQKQAEVKKQNTIYVPNYIDEQSKKKIEENGVYVDITTGEVTRDTHIDYDSFPSEVDITINAFKGYLASFPKEIGQPLIDVINKAISVTGELPVASALKSMPDEMHTYLNYIKYGNYEQAIGMFSANLLNYIDRHFEMEDWLRNELEDAIADVMTDDEIDQMQALKILQQYAKQGVQNNYTTFDSEKFMEKLR